MDVEYRLRDAIGDARGAEAADRLCEACVGVLDVDAAAISVVFDGANVGTFGASSALARIYDELQFTLGEGPGIDSVARRAPVIVADLADPNERRWPPYVSVMRSHGIRGVFAAPLAVVGNYVGALDLYRAVPGGPMTEQAAGMSIAAGLAQLLLLDLMTSNVHAVAAGPDGDAWPDLIGWSRNEVSQATGMLMTQLNVDAATALARLRAHAYSTGRSATSVAIDIIDRRLRMEAN